MQPCSSHQHNNLSHAHKYSVSTMVCACLDHYFELAKPDSRAVNFPNPSKYKKIHNPDCTWYVNLAAQPNSSGTRLNQLNQNKVFCDWQIQGPQSKYLRPVFFPPLKKKRQTPTVKTFDLHSEILTVLPDLHYFYFTSLKFLLFFFPVDSIVAQSPIFTI